jgi:hypothetical protein
VVAQVKADDLLVAVPELTRRGDRHFTIPNFRWLPGTWRAAAHPELSPLPPGHVISYLNPVETDDREESSAAVPGESTSSAIEGARKRHAPSGHRRVIDREDIQPYLPVPDTARAS